MLTLKILFLFLVFIVGIAVGIVICFFLVLKMMDKMQEVSSDEREMYETEYSIDRFGIVPHCN